MRGYTATALLAAFLAPTVDAAALKVGNVRSLSTDEDIALAFENSLNLASYTDCGASCTEDVWNAAAGTSTCGIRISYFIRKGLSAGAACERIADSFVACTACGAIASEESALSPPPSPPRPTVMDYPSFSWDIVPQYWYSTNPTGDFDDDTAAYAASFPIVVPNGNHRRWVEPSARQEESKLYAVAQQILAKNASAKLIFYLNTMMDWTQFELHHTLAGYESNGTQYCAPHCPPTFTVNHGALMSHCGHRNPCMCGFTARREPQ